MADLSMWVKLALLDQFTQPMGKASWALKGFSKELENAQKLGERYSSAGRDLALMGVGLAGGVGVAVKSYSDLEGVQARLANTMTTLAGPDQNWTRINELAREAGDTYEGTTTDFYKLALSMKQVGADSSFMVDGAFQAAAAMRTMTGLGPAEAGESFAVMAKAMGITGKESMVFADAVQRASTSAGIKINDLTESLKGMGSYLHVLGVGGLNDSKTVLAMMGALRQAGVDGAEVGGVLDAAFKNMATIIPKLKSGKGEIIQQVQEAMNQAGVKLNFFGAKGEFLGMENFVDQFSRLKNVSIEKRMLLGRAFFGREGAKLALLDQPGMAAAARAMLQQESIGKRVERMNQTTGLRMAAVGEKTQNALASLGKAVTPMLNPVLDGLARLLTWAQKFADAHPKVTAGLVGITGGFGGLALGVGGSLFVLGKLISMGSQAMNTLGLLKGAVIGLPGALSKMSVGIWGSVKAIWAQTTALAMSPITWVVGGIVLLGTAAYFLWKNWDKVTAWFKRTWTWFQGLWAKVPGWAKWLFPMIHIPMLIIQNWDKIKGFFGGLWTFLTGMVSKLWTAGSNLAKAIWEGIKSMASKPVEAIKDIVQKVRNFLPFSPAKEGPLRDLHRVRIVETIAESIRPGALMGKMTQVARVAALPMALALPGAGSGGGGIHIQIHVHQAPGTDPQDARRLAQDLEPHLVRILGDHMDRQARRRY